MRDERTLEALAGVEYNGGCWALRAGRTPLRHRDQRRQHVDFFVQLELNGVSRIGSNPLDVLRRNIGGYTQRRPAQRRRTDRSTTIARSRL